MDYRFKISGSSRPFRVQLYSGTTISAANEVKDVAVDYSGTCIILNNLKECTQYTLSVADNINKTFIAPSGCTNTSSIGPQVSASTTPTKTFSIIGNPTQPSGPIPGTVCYVPPPKTLSIDPPLGANDCACVYADVILDDGGDDVLNEVKFYKSCDGGAYDYLIGYSSNKDTTPSGTDDPLSIMLRENDSICYDLSSVYGGSGIGDNKGSAEIQIRCVNPVSNNFESEIDSCSAITTNIDYTVTTTTTTTTAAPIVLNFDPVVDCDSLSRVWTLRSAISASRPLQTGECVEICFTNCAKSAANQFANSIDSIGCWYDSEDGSSHGQVCASIPSNTIDTDNQQNFDSIILTPENQDLVQICLDVGVSTLDMDKDVYACAYTYFNRLDKCVGANFCWGGGSLDRLELKKIGSGSVSGGGTRELLLDEPNGNGDGTIEEDSLETT